MKQTGLLQLVTGATRVSGVIGHPVEHSVSPQLHNTISLETGNDIIYVPFNVAPGTLEEAVKGMRALNMIGFNVTIPYKKEIIKYLDDITKEALLVGAVNTVKNICGRLYGYNTDVEGFARSFREETGTCFKGKNVLMFGAGGAARAIAVKLANDGAAAICICNRNGERSSEICSLVNDNIRHVARTITSDAAEIAREAAAADIVINASSSGMRLPEEGEGAYVSDGFGFAGLPLERRHIVYDIVYNPPETLLLKRAAECGCTAAISGLGMLFYQGILAYEIWTGHKLSKELLQDLYRKFCGVKMN